MRSGGWKVVRILRPPGAGRKARHAASPVATRSGSRRAGEGHHGVQLRFLLAYRLSGSDCASSRLNPLGGRMLWTIFVILLVLWLLGMVSSYTLGGFIHILLVVALAIVLIRVIQGRRPV